jgi:hypothetical protein
VRAFVPSAARPPIRQRSEVSRLDAARAVIAPGHDPQGSDPGKMSNRG